MPQPGWYADPDGTPERLRWWDGTRWSEHVHGGIEPGQQGPPRRGVWPWVALVGVAGLVVTVGFGLGTGLFGGAGVPDTAVAPSPPTQVRQAPATASTSPSVRPTPTLTPTPTARSPKPSPTTTPSAPLPDPWAECPPTGEDGTLSDGQLVLSLPPGWVADDGPAWLLCAKAGTSPRQDATVTLGVSDWPTASLEETAGYIWAMSLADAETYPQSRTSDPVTVGGLDAWVVTGTVPLGERPHELTVVVVDVGWGEPSVVVTLAGAGDKRAGADIHAILDSLHPA